jgi:hypothetical protein
MIVFIIYFLNPSIKINQKIPILEAVKIDSNIL